jgi:hypothetical protein
MRKNNKKINVGIGFVTGRKDFKKVAKAYIQSFSENDELDCEQYALHLFVAYDLNYKGTQVSDYQITDEELLSVVDSAHYLGPSAISTEADTLVKDKVITAREAKLIFGEGYAMKRNAVLYFAVKNKMDSIIFLDDDEYPIANIRLEQGIAWKGQEILSAHIKGIQKADMTHGHHCGYISPIPQFRFNETLSEDEFHTFIGAISNDIINWESVKEKMEAGGVTYASAEIMEHTQTEWVEAVDGMKFISGANLAICLKETDKIFPFYNPPGARGEDTFLSTCISDCRVLKVGCYTFHDAYSAYGQLLSGILPEHLKEIDTETPFASKRFLQAAIGWIRYKPLLLYITQPKEYLKKMESIEEALKAVLPKFCQYFGNNDFQIILKEFRQYRALVNEHFTDFENTKKAWIDVMNSLKMIPQEKKR